MCLSGWTPTRQPETNRNISLVPRHSLLTRCPREVWETGGERTRSRRVYLGDVTAYGRVQD